MRRWAVSKARRFLLFFSLFAAACNTPEAAPPAAKQLVFLTREGCVNTDIMRARLDDALKTFTPSPSYSVADLDALPADHVRRGYPTPTILIGGADLFGMAAPTPPFPDPT
jgi:hypothetical protein